MCSWPLRVANKMINSARCFLHFKTCASLHLGRWKRHQYAAQELGGVLWIGVYSSDYELGRTEERGGGTLDEGVEHKMQTIIFCYTSAIYA